MHSIRALLVLPLLTCKLFLNIIFSILFTVPYPVSQLQINPDPARCARRIVSGTPDLQPRAWYQVPTRYTEYAQVCSPPFPAVLSNLDAFLIFIFIESSFAVRTKNVENRPVVNERGKPPSFIIVTLLQCYSTAPEAHNCTTGAD